MDALLIEIRDTFFELNHTVGSFDPARFIPKNLKPPTSTETNAGLIRKVPALSPGIFSYGKLPVVMVGR